MTASVTQVTVVGETTVIGISGSITAPVVAVNVNATPVVEASITPTPIVAVSVGVQGPPGPAGSGGSGGSGSIASNTAPNSPSLGTLWYDDVSGRLYVYYDSSWIDASPKGAGVVSFIPTGTKASNATGTTGQISYDADYIYICTATNTWKRSPLNGGY